MFLDVIIKSNDETYFYLYKILNKNKYVYTDNINDISINNLIINKIDSQGYINESLLNLEDVINNNNINKIYIEKENNYFLRLKNKYKFKSFILEENKIYIEEINKLKSIILLKYILDENKQSVYNLKILILGDNSLANSIINLLNNLNTSNDQYNKDLTNIINLEKYDIIINTSNLTINPELLFNVKKTLIIYDLTIKSRLDTNVIFNNFIKYRYINNVSLYLPIAKANIIYELMCKYDSL